MADPSMTRHSYLTHNVCCRLYAPLPQPRLAPSLAFRVSKLAFEDEIPNYYFKLRIWDYCLAVV